MTRGLGHVHRDHAVRQDENRRVYGLGGAGSWLPAGRYQTSAQPLLHVVHIVLDSRQALVDCVEHGQPLQLDGELLHGELAPGFHVRALPLGGDARLETGDLLPVAGAGRAIRVQLQPPPEDLAAVADRHRPLLGDMPPEARPAHRAQVPPHLRREGKQILVLTPDHAPIDPHDGILLVPYVSISTAPTRRGSPPPRWPTGDYI